MGSRLKLALLVFAVLAVGYAYEDYQKYSARTNAAAVWGWIFTRWFEWTQNPDELLRSEKLRKLRADSNCRPAFLKEQDVPARPGARPQMVRGVPHRQLDQHASAAVRALMDGTLGAKNEFPGAVPVSFISSRWELTGARALILEGCTPQTCHANMLRSRGEFAHLHSHDGSFHVALSAPDLALVIEKGWGELFPASGLLGGRVPYIALVYAPRDAGEWGVVRRILGAGHRLALHATPGRACRLNPP